MNNPFLRFRKRSAFLSLVSLLLFAVGVRAQEPGDYTYEVVNETTVTITGYTGPGGAISIPSVIDGLPVTAIGGGAFSNRSDITGNLVIPEGVTSIGSSAFSWCSGLTGNLVIPEGVTSIGNYAFSSCSGFDGTLTLPSTLASIGSSAFSWCYGLTGDLVIPEGVTSIGDYAFSWCYGLTGDLVIPEGVTSIGDYAFSWCYGLDGTLTLPSTLASIGNSVFYCCYGLTGNLVIPEGVTSIGGAAFSQCYGLTGITVESGNLYYSSVDGMLLSKDGTVLIQCPGGKTGSLVIPGSVTTIEEDAFSGCSGLTGDLVIPEGVTSIGNSAFDGCSGLTGNLVIPEGVTSIGNNAFDGCSNLSSVTFMGDAPTTMGSDVFADMSNDLIIYYQPGASGFDAEPWQGLACEEWVDRQPFTHEPFECELVNNSTVTIKGYTGTGGDVVIPDSIDGKPVTAIGARAFEMKLNSDNPGSLTLPSGLVSIGVSAFEFCSGMTGALVLPENLVSIGERAFVGCRITGDVTIPQAVTTIGSGAFFGCNGLTAINVAVSNAQYSSLDGALYNKDQTQLVLVPAAKTGTFSIPSSVTAIADYAVAYCNQLTGTMVLPPNLVTIGDMAFVGCIGFTGEVVIPASVTSVGSGAFQSVGVSVISVDADNPSYSSVDGMLLSKDGTVLIQCPMGKTGALVFPGTVTRIGDRAFSGCSGLTGQLVIPVGVERIGNSAFAGCTGFTGQLVVENTVTIVDSQAFWGCQGITSALFKGNAPSTGEELFEGTAEGFKIYHLAEATGYASSWGGWPYYPCEVWVENPVDPNWQYTIADNAVTITGYTGAIENPVIPDTIEGLPVTAIGYRAFWRRTDITGSLTLPSTLETIGDEAFYRCSALTGDLVIPEGVTSIGYLAFYWCPGFDGTLTLPSTLASIGDYAFSWCSGLTGNLVIPEGVTSIGSSAFSWCYGLTGDLVIPEGVTSIGSSAFSWCYGLTGDLVIPEGVTSIGDDAFSGCSGLTGITVESGNLYYSSVDGMLLSKDGTVLIQCPGGKTGSLVIPEGVTSIGSSAFSGCSGLTGNLVIPEGVTSIAYNAFGWCSNLSSVTFMGDAPTTMGSDVFADMSNDLIIYYQSGASGFDAPEWQGIDLEMIPNRAPRFRMIGNQTIKAGETITFEVIADDEDAGDVLQYSATKP